MQSDLEVKLAELDAYTAELRKLRYAESSSDKVRVACGQLDKFLTEYDIRVDAVSGMSDNDLSRYIAHLTRRGLTYGTIKGYLSMGVRRWHIDRNIPFVPIASRPRVQDTQQGARRVLGDADGKQKLPITIQMLNQMRAKTNLADPFQLCLFTAISTGMFCLLRKANLAVKNKKVVAAKPQGLRPKHSSGELLRSDVSVDQLKNLWVTLRQTKTVQFGEHAIIHIPLPKVGTAGPICPTALLLLYMNSTKERPATEQLFGYYDKHKKWVPLTHAVLVKHIKHLVQSIGLNPALYAGHSLRRGGATFGFNEAGLDALTIKAIGDWVSDTFMRYCEIQLGHRLAGAKRMAQALSTAPNKRVVTERSSLIL